jgi:hypothetical protein
MPLKNVQSLYNNNTGHNYQHIPRATQYQDHPSSFPPQNNWPQNFHPRSRPNYRISGGNQNNYRPQGQSSINQNTHYNQNRYSLPEKCSYCLKKWSLIQVIWGLESHSAWVLFITNWNSNDILTSAKTWNDLPDHFRKESSFSQFKNLINSWNGRSCHCSAYEWSPIFL